MNQQQQREFILKQLEMKRADNAMDLFKEWQLKEEGKILNQQRSYYRATVWSL